MSDSNASKDAVVIERIFEAPVALIWQMWTQADHFQKWYGPKGASVPVAEIDLHIGGKRLVCMEMQRPDGAMQMWTAGKHTEVLPHKRLVFTEGMSDEKGNLLPPSAMGMPGDKPMVTEVTVELEDLDGRTKMVLTHAGVPAGSPGESGWNQALDKLKEYVVSLE